MVINLPHAFEQVIREAAKLPELSHIIPKQILVLVHRLPPRRQGQTTGLCQVRRTRVFDPVFPRVQMEGRHIRYVISLNPRICVSSEPACDPLSTVIHELWHIAPESDGTIRRMRHGRAFHDAVLGLVKAYREQGRKELPRLRETDAIITRSWRTKKTPCTAYVRKHLRVAPDAALANIGWKKDWSEQDISIQTRPLHELLPSVYHYRCPNGHDFFCHVQFRKPRSCATCCPRFNKRFLYTCVA